MEKRQTEIKSLKPGGFVLIDDVPMRVDKIQLSKSGKHGAAKARIFVSGLFDNSKKTVVKPGDSRVDVPIIEKSSAQVIAFVGDRVQLMDLQSYEMSEVAKPDIELKEGDEVLVWRFGSYVQIKGKK